MLAFTQSLHQDTEA
ncbi:hypothetical protein C347_05853 [Cryptococcus neoformans AD2-60a]|nr:hypothetical protein C347_05853 [Cryptococcus neoformans var. grubii AD2-60a]